VSVFGLLIVGQLSSVGITSLLIAGQLFVVSIKSSCISISGFLILRALALGLIQLVLELVAVVSTMRLGMAIVATSVTAAVTAATSTAMIAARITVLLIAGSGIRSALRRAAGPWLLWLSGSGVVAIVLRHFILGRLSLLAAPVAEVIHQI